MNINKPVIHKPHYDDHLIIERVRNYLEEHQSSAHIDINELSRHLHEKYVEYRRRKFVPFRKVVKRACDVISKMYNLDVSDGHSSEDDSDCHMMQEEKTPNVMNSMLSNMYAKKRPQPVSEPPTAVPDSIPLSSDEDEKVSGNKELRSPPPPSPASESKRVKLTVTEVKRFLHKASAARNGDSGVVKQGQPSTFSFQKAPPKKANVQYPQSHMQQQKQRQVKRYKKMVKMQESYVNFRKIGGMEKTLKDICELMLHIKSPYSYYALGLNPPCGILLHGPPGCGKTLLARAIAGQMKMHLVEVPACELIGGLSGESEERIRDVFEQAALYSPCVLFIDDVDVIAMNRNVAQKDMERRMVSQLITCMDNLRLQDTEQGVLVIGATTRPESMDPALRRVGRFEHEIPISIPNRKDRKHILMMIMEDLVIDPHFDYDKLAELTPGYVGADLGALVTRASFIAIKRKGAQQIRAAKMRVESDMFTVDLDADEETSSADKVTVGDGKVSESATEMVVDKVTHEDSDVAESSEKVDEKVTPDDSNVAESVTKISSEKIDDKVTLDDSNVAESVTKISTEMVAVDRVTPVSTETSTEMVEDKPMDVEVPLKEVTLLELMHFLDNPPDEIHINEDFFISMEDFRQALKQIQPAAKREGFVTVPDVTWDDVGSLQNIREELKLAVLAPVKYPERLKKLGLSAPSGVLLCGPPGCGKTLLAKAIANEAGINFISVKGPELMSMYVGESERAVRVCFQRARNSAPCVIFFDEFDSLCPKRSTGADASSGTRIVNQLLTEMDGVEDRQGVYILAATNRPDIIDPAILRPGRLDTILYVGLPDFKDRVDILKATTKNRTKPLLHEDVNFEYLAERTNGFTGADMAGLVRQAAMLVLKESLFTPDESDTSVAKRHFEEALTMLRPSVTPQDRKIYENLRVKFAAPRAKSVPPGDTENKSLPMTF